VAYRLSGGHGGDHLCIDVKLTRERTSFGCGDDVVQRGRHIDLSGYVYGGGRWAQINGTASRHVRRVVVHYRNGGRGKLKAKLVRVVAPLVLEKIETDQPFGYYVGEVPTSARTISVVALGQAGDVIDRAAFRRPPWPYDRARKSTGRIEH
jgi:hypothetical protein